MSAARRHGPASHAQEALWLATQARADLPAYNSAFALHLRGPLDVPCLAEALANIVTRHDSLHSTVALRGEHLVQLVHPAPAAVLDVADCPASATESQAARLAAELFDLERGPLLRLRLLRCSAQYAVLVLVVHHLTWDAGSMRVFLDELSRGYAALAAGDPDPGRRPPLQYLDHSARERAELTGESMERHLAYFRERLAGLPEFLDLPTDRPRPPVRSFSGATEPIELGARTTAALRALASSERAPLASVLLAGVQGTLAAYAGTGDIPVGIASSLRPRTDLESLIGCFVNPLVVRQQTGGRSLRELVLANRAEIAGCLDHQQLPFDRLVRELAPRRSVSQHPLFQVMFSFQQRPARQRRMGTVELEVKQIGKNLAKYDLSFVLENAADESIAGLLSYSTDLFEAATARQLVTHLCRLLAGGARQPGQPLDRLPVLAPGEEAAALGPAPEPALGPGPDRGPEPAPGRGPEGAPDEDLAGLFAAQAAAVPDAVAMLDAATGQTVTYRQLDAAASAVAARLRRSGLPPEGIVAVAAPLGADAAAAVLGTLRAGGAFFFCSPDYPAALSRQLIRACQAVAVLTVSRDQHQFTDVPARVLALDDPPTAADAHTGDAHTGDAHTGGGQAGGGSAADARPARIDPDRLACVSFTSGSTGEPKGVLLTHRGIAGYLRAVQEEHSLTAADRMAWKANLAFDAAVAELLQPLLIGATAVLLEARARTEPAALAAAIARHQITVLGLPAVLLRGLAREPGLARCQSLRLVTSGGEPMVAATVAAFAARSAACSGARLVNRYGPSEASIAVTSFDATDWTGPGPAPLGRARAGSRVCVLDGRRRVTPPGVVGEIYVGGPALARGYAGQRAATARAFTPDPYRRGARLYATGDRGRYRHDGTIEFVGRADEQVKIRGVRIEPAAIAAALQADPMVRTAAVTVHEDPAGDRDGRVLVAHVEPAGPARCDPARLRAVLASSLPPHLVPAVVQVSDRLPRTHAGKVDLRALAQRPLVLAGADATVPRTPTQRRLAAIWSRLLGLEPVPAATSFFALGGHSLLAVRLSNQVRAEFGRDIDLRDILEQPTIEQLATVIDAAPRWSGQDRITPSRRRGQLWQS